MLIDLTMPLREGIAAFPSHGRSVLELSPVMRHSDYAGRGRYNTYDGDAISFEVSQWLLGDQSGTHMDAPFHADAGSPLSIDRVPLELGFGPAVWLDCAAAATEGGVTLEVLQDALGRSGEQLERGDIVLLRTGASDDATTAPVEYAVRALGLTRQAAEWLRAAGVRTVGIDCVTIECADSARTVDVHTNFLRPAALGLPPSQVIGVIENLVGLSTIPVHRFHLSALPLPLVGAAGSPVRAVASVP
jgi:kynurenine formamidase